MAGGIALASIFTAYNFLNEPAEAEGVNIPKDLSFLRCSKLSQEEAFEIDLKESVKKNDEELTKKRNFDTSAVNMHNRPFIIVGPSGVGKSTLIKAFEEKHPNKLGFSVSYTTRNPRKGEEHGVNYFFVTKDEFKTMIANDEFIEHCEVHGNYYGTSKKQIRDIQAKGKIPLLDIDIQGTIKFLKVFPETNTLFVFPPAFEDLKARLEKRGTESPETLAKRLGNASNEMSQGLVDDDEYLIGYRLINKDLGKSKKVFINLMEALYEKDLK